MNKENLIKYVKTIGVKINEDEPIENIYEKVTGNSYNDYLKEQEETKKERYKINYEKIPVDIKCRFWDKLHSMTPPKNPIWETSALIDPAPGML